MRAIKFRAWLPSIKKMTYAHSINELIGWHKINGYTPNIKWLQYTGLKDKDEVGIYEGDILLNKSSITQPDGILTTKIIGDIQILNGMTYLVGKTWQDVDGEDIRLREYKALMLNPELFKIIANIYENPEILRGDR